MSITSIARYLELPRAGQCHSSRERISGVGPCVQIFSKWIRCSDEGYKRWLAQPEEDGIKLFDKDDNIKFLLNLQPNSSHYLALSGHAISVFYSHGGKATEKLCDDNDEIIGHGVVTEMKYNKEDAPTRCVTMKFKILVVFKSGIVRRVIIHVTSTFRNLQMRIKKITEYNSTPGTLIAAPLMDKSNIVLIYEDTIVKGDGTVCRGTPAEGRQVVYAEGGFPWKSKIFLVTDDGEAHYARMTGKVGDGKILLFGCGKTTRSSSGLNIRHPTCACLCAMCGCVDMGYEKDIAVGTETGELYHLNTKDLSLIDNDDGLQYGPLTFLQSHGNELWIGWNEGDFMRFEDIC